MNRGIRNMAVLVGTLAAITVSAPVHAEDDDMPMMQQNRPGMMGGGGMGMMGQGRGMGMMGGGMMGPGMMSGGMGMMGGGGMGMGMTTMHALDLDRDQVSKMAQIHKELAQKRAAMSADMQELRWDLSREMAKDRPDPSQVGKLYGQIADQQRAMMENRIRARNRMMDALSDKQRERWQQMMDNRRDMRMGGNMPMDMDDE